MIMEQLLVLNWNCNIKKLFTYLILGLCPALFAQKVNILPDSIGYCQGDSTFLEIKLPLDNTTSIQWDTPYGIITNTKKIRANKSGKYYLKLSSPQYTNPIKDSSIVTIYLKPKLNLRDTIICKGGEIMLDAKNPGLNYLWNTFETTQKIKIQKPGRYWVVITNGSCNSIDTVYIKPVVGSGVVLNKDYSFCLNEEIKTISVKTNPGTKIVWSTGSTNSSIYVPKEGVYWVKTEMNNCGAQYDTIRVKMKVCECEMMIPTSFTPNEDNRNDYFYPIAKCDYSYYLLTINDRWGNSVFASNSITAKWDGRFKGNLCPEDVYVYKIESTEKGSDKKMVRTGHLSLFR
jgi:gliding motility-associated-like protein